MIADNNWYDEMWMPITGSTGAWPNSFGQNYCNRFKGDARFNMTSQHILMVNKNLFILEKPFPSSSRNHFIDSPVGDKLTFHKYRMSTITERYKTGRTLYTNPCSEMFDDNIPDTWIKTVFEACVNNPQHNYVFVTTNVGRLVEFQKTYPDLITENMWFGISINESIYKHLPAFERNIRSFNGPAHLFLYFDVPSLWNGAFLESLLFDVADKFSWVLVNFKWGYSKEIYSQFDNFTKEFKIPLYIERSDVATFRRETPKEFSRVVYAAGRKKIRVAKCGGCKGEYEKKSMHTIGSYVKRGDGYKVVGWLCDKCYEEFKKQFE